MQWDGLFILNQGGRSASVEEWIDSDFAPSELKEMKDEQNLRLGTVQKFGRLALVPYRSLKSNRITIHNLASAGASPHEQTDCRERATLRRLSPEQIRLQIDGRPLEQLSESEWPFCISSWNDVVLEFDCGVQTATVPVVRSLGLQAGRRLQSQSLFAPFAADVEPPCRPYSRITLLYRRQGQQQSQIMQ